MRIESETTRSEKSRKYASRRSKEARLLWEDNGLCNNCGKQAPRTGLLTCQDCADRDRKNALAVRERTRKEFRKERRDMVAKFGDPADIWLDNESRDDVKMREIVNPIRALRAIDSWMREC